MQPFTMGPAGGNGGKPFEAYAIPEGARLTAFHIFAEWVVNAIQFEYARADGSTGSNPPIGGLGGEHHVFYLDEDEYLTGISGKSGWYVDSIRLHTNKRESPLFGGASGEREYAFNAPTGHEIAGLFGRSDWYIDALGVTLRPVAAPAVLPDDDDSSWMEIISESEPVAATIAVRRRKVASQEELDALEEEAVAEAIAAHEGDDGEGAVDVAVYTQVLDGESGGDTVAVVMAVAAEVDGGLEVVGDEPNEAAVMVTDAIHSDSELAVLEEEAVEGAIEALYEDAGDIEEDLDLTIYTGVTNDDEDGESYAAVVAIASRLVPEQAARAPQSPAASAVSGPRSQDLERVEGIGPKIAELLIAHDIFDLADLAAAPVERLREILGGAGKRFRLADPTTWPQQAALGARGLWDELAALQSRLKAGR